MLAMLVIFTRNVKRLVGLPSTIGLLLCLSLLLDSLVLSLSDSGPERQPTAVQADENTSSNADSLDNVCYNFGCPLLPRDVFYDANAKAALHRLKEPTRKLHEEEEKADNNNKASAIFLAELNSSGDRHKTTMTLCGYKGGSIDSQVNQDRSILVSPFLGEYQVLGVLDGHGDGGEIVSEYARQEIPKLVAAKLEEIIAATVDKESDATTETNKSFLVGISDASSDEIARSLKEVFIDVDKSAPKASHSGGSTASVALQLGPKLFVANAGDSVTLVAAHRGWNESSTIVYISREDKPHLPDEKERVEKAGGMVLLPKTTKDGDSSRVVYKDPSTNMDVGLAMSRSIGDWDAPGVTAEPIVDVLDLPTLAERVLKGIDEFDCDTATTECGPPDVNFFVVSATDGLMDFLEPQTIADKVGITFFGRPSLQDRQSGVGAGHAHLAAEELIYTAARGWHEAMQGSYRDDITLSTAKIFPWEVAS